MMKFVMKLAALAMIGGVMSGCAYGGVAMSADGSKAVVLKNDAFLFGLLNSAHVCNVEGTDLNCTKSKESP